jgi:acetyltransferase EpsM
MKVIVIGNGGHSKVIQEMILASRYEVMAILDDKYENEYTKQGILYAPISTLGFLLESNVKVVIAIGNNAIRKKIVQQLDLQKDQYVSVIHPKAVISPTAKIKNGTVIMANAVINAEAKIGEHCIINTGTIIEHENEIGDYAHISPNATLTGNVSVGEGVHVGASASIIPGVEVGTWSVVGAGSTVIKNVPPNSVAVGCPTRVVKHEPTNYLKDKGGMTL